MISEKPTNLGINNDLLMKARKRNTNLSPPFEEALAGQLKRKQQELWRRQNTKTIKAFNRFVQAHGVFSDGRRNF
ncbi:type II toxin-antitoxin system CcdA family antitoxin [bacterium]|nr:type II toxin-antitoxin system CcdA family antitoxin [bacterium]